MTARFSTAMALVSILSLVACDSAEVPASATTAAARTPARDASDASDPIEVPDAYEAGTMVTLAKLAPQNTTGLHNVFELSDSIISGSEPHGEAAFEDLAARGVKVILSVDGKIPDAELAARHGMRYVHVPIRYSGMSEEQLEHIAKTFRDLDGPFYVHCFHGKHRGPAAAAVGRIVRDGVPRTQALAEMRQWCGTSKKYGGLYRLIATRAMPTSAETDASSWQFDAAYQVDGIASAMVAIPRTFDNLKDLAKRNFAVDPEHPDIDAANEAAQLHQLMQAACDLEETRESPDDFRGWMSASRDESKALHDLLVRVGNGDQAAIAEAGEAVGRVGSLCDACHVPYRN